MNERRASERTALSGRIELVAPATSCGASLVDVSEGGVRVHATDAPGQWGDLVLLRRVGEHENGVKCTIVRVLPDGVGVELGLRFDPSEADGQRRVLDLLA